MPEILLVSGWQTCNIGDVGHTPGTLRYLEQFIPEASLSVYLHNWNDAVLAMLTARFPAVRFIAAKSKVHCSSAGELQDPRLRDAFEHADLVIQNSGMHYNGFYDVDPWLIRKCVESGKPYGLYGQSFDGFTPKQLPAMKAMLGHAAFVSCRDLPSVRYLQSEGVSPDWLGFVPDGCFGIDVRDDFFAGRLLERLSLEAGEFITVTLRSNTPSSDLSAANVLNPAFISEENRKENERWAVSLREVIIAWVERTGKPVLLAPEVDKEIAAAHALIWQQLPERVRQHVRQVDAFWNVEQAASVYARATAVLSMEPHSCIIALANGTPAIHFYSPKHGVKAQMFAAIGRGEWLFDINQDAPEKVICALMQIRSDRLAARKKVQDAMDIVNDCSQKLAAVIRERLGFPPAGSR